MSAGWGRHDLLRVDELHPEDQTVSSNEPGRQRGSCGLLSRGIWVVQLPILSRGGVAEPPLGFGAPTLVSMERLERVGFTPVEGAKAGSR